jgi:hypothetical protein
MPQEVTFFILRPQQLPKHARVLGDPGVVIDFLRTGLIQRAVEDALMHHFQWAYSLLYCIMGK